MHVGMHAGTRTHACRHAYTRMHKGCNPLPGSLTGCVPAPQVCSGEVPHPRRHLHPPPLHLPAVPSNQVSATGSCPVHALPHCPPTACSSHSDAIGQQQCVRLDSRSTHRPGAPSAQPSIQVFNAFEDLLSPPEGQGGPRRQHQLGCGCTWSLSCAGSGYTVP
jgi:hypothetical protein